jgi:hypothetical protein
MLIGVVSHVGHNPTSTDDNWSRFFTIGPMTRYAEDLAPMLKVLANKNADKLRLDEEVRINSVICALRYVSCLQQCDTFPSVTKCDNISFVLQISVISCEIKIAFVL